MGETTLTLHKRLTLPWKSEAGCENFFKNFREVYIELSFSPQIIMAVDTITIKFDLQSKEMDLIGKTPGFRFWGQSTCMTSIKGQENMTKKY